MKEVITISIKQLFVGYLTSYILAETGRGDCMGLPCCSTAFIFLEKDAFASKDAGERPIEHFDRHVY